MGNCCSGGNKDTEIDLYMSKHHRRSHIVTEKDSYEVSKQQWNPLMQNIRSKQVGEDLLVDDEVS